jgi:flagellar biosynthesis/type III secretory pathway chaperone
MNKLLSNLIESLREELQQYGEMLALLEQQQLSVVQRKTDDLLQNVAAVNTQVSVIAAQRQEREQRQRSVALEIGLGEGANFGAIVPMLPADYRPLVEALVQENNELLARVQQRTRQNHLLLSHAVELTQQLIETIFPRGRPRVYDQAGRLPGFVAPAYSLYERVG